jgi:signal transduction histidine kinase
MAVDPAPVAASPGDPPAGEAGRWVQRLELQRQLHDGAAVRISAVALRLGVVLVRVPEERPDLRAGIEDAQEELHVALQELRSVARQIYPPLLDLAGLGPALREAAGGAAVPVVVVAPPDRFPVAVEGALYFAVTGCLRALPPDGGPVRVLVRRAGDVLVVVVDGVPARLAAGVQDEVRGLGGRVSAAGDPAAATIEVVVPCG